MKTIRPDICVSIGNVDSHAISILLPKLSLAEIRIDLLNLNRDELKLLFGLHENLIATYRPKGSEFDVMLNLLTDAIGYGAAWVDVDIDTSTEIIREITAIAQAANCKVIISYHNYTETPTYARLKKIIENAQTYNVSLVKIACMANSPSDCARVLSLYEENTSIVAFCMGQVGTITRVAAPLLGAPFTYAALPGNQTAPGQLDYIYLESLLNSLKPL
ncbi:MAG: type I 3-dehydroquinate dehydratase [Bacteroidales bacterium]|nr:type I 3-dehydroquinate dehydratase [Bacteroidales bacterium]